MTRADLRRHAAVAATAVALVAGLVAVASVSRAGHGDRVVAPPTPVSSTALMRLTSSTTRPRSAAGGSSGGSVEPAPRWVRRTAAATGIPRAAVKAYARAALRIAVSQPGCHLGWTTLAGLGWVESEHGTTGGRVLYPTGVSSTPILGPALDGSKGVARLRDGASYVRALGPLQFLPATWATWGSDGDGDRAKNVDDLDDAALGAARYLCADGHDLATVAGWNAAILSYNHSTDYVFSVYRAAVVYNGRS